MSPREDIDRAVAELRAFFLAELAARDKALALQAAEYERRLTALNGERDTLARMKNDFVLRVVYDKDIEKHDKELSDAAKATAEAAAKQRVAIVTALTAAGIAIVGWVISVVLHFLPE